MSRDEGVVLKVLAHTEGAMALASRKAFLDDAERLAEAGIAMVPDLLERPSQASGASGAAENPGSGIEAAMRGALGWVYFNQGRIEEARRELFASYRIEPRLASTLLHLGTLHESEEDFEAAETWYIRCAALPTGDDHPCANVLGDYYVRREGSTAGFDAWLASIRNRIYAESAARISEHRFEPPIAVRPFALKSLEGNPVTLDDLEGKLSIVKFWAVWCGPCRMEMPEFADFVSRFADNRDVEVMTVNLDPNPESVRRWLDENGLELPVLIDDGYSNRVGVTGLPTTWFLDGEGRKVYEVIGAIPELENEYVARLEMMRVGATD
jgi:thiol-disulfide isomerase/thioredoxin